MCKRSFVRECEFVHTHRERESSWQISSFMEHVCTISICCLNAINEMTSFLASTRNTIECVWHKCSNWKYWAHRMYGGACVRTCVIIKWVISYTFSIAAHYLALFIYSFIFSFRLIYSIASRWSFFSYLCLHILILTSGYRGNDAKRP